MSGRRLASPFQGEVERPVEDAMIKPLEIAVRARQGIVEDPNRAKAGRGEPFEERVGEDVAGSRREEDSAGTRLTTPHVRVYTSAVRGRAP